MNTIDMNSTCTVAKSHCRCFDLLTDEQLELLEKKQVEVKFNKGEIIAKQGAFATHVIFLCEGLVKVYLEDNDEKLILKIIGPGNLVGLTSLRDDDEKFSYTAASYQNSIVKMIDINVFKKLIRENGLFASRIIQFMGENAAQINNRFFCMIHRQSYGKLADLLLCLAGSVFKSDEFELLLTRRELAELAGLSTESVIRLLKDFQNEKLISIEGKKFIILNHEGLKKICKIG